MIFHVLLPIPALAAVPGDYLVVRPLGGGVHLIREFSNAEALSFVSTDAVAPVLPSEDEQPAVVTLSRRPIALLP